MQPKLIKPSLILWVGWVVLSFSGQALSAPEPCDLHSLITQNKMQEATQCLLEGRADPNQLNSTNQTPLTRLDSFTMMPNMLKNPTTHRFVRELIASGANVNHRVSPQTLTPFQAMLAGGHLAERQDLILLMLQKGADNSVGVRQIDSGRMITPLIWSIKYHQHEAFDYLVDTGRYLGRVPLTNLASPFMHALHYANVHALKVLFAKQMAADYSPYMSWRTLLSSPAEDIAPAVSVLIMQELSIEWQNHSKDEIAALFKLVSKHQQTNPNLYAELRNYMAFPSDF
ncbi:ankyrin repeat domain-containing protein [Thiomicrospira microaerophila]|uniref:ankyrin repeat domain-containing protein n=1 Tax=Thiomicrospira microaerophila TaxID=406020 RepID=UPI0012FE0D20|nr:ankyrin repeat domain-containing protein [Thiomicrospira microaerophila]